MHLLILSSQPVIDALGWSILHSCWQGLLIFVTLRLLLLMLPNISSNAKYNLCLIALTAIAGWFLFTFFHQCTDAKALAAAAGLSSNNLVNGSYLFYQHINASSLTTGNNIPYLEKYFPFLAAAYLLGLTYFILKFATDYAMIIRLKLKSTQPIDHSWEKYARQLADKLQLHKNIQLRLSDLIDVPMMIGYIKPIILFPLASFNQLSPEQLEAVILHELAHIRRNDYVVNILQTLADTLLFFNPFVWWISKKIREERESCCDDIVVSQTNPLQYAKALLTLEENRNRLAIAMAATGNKKQLFKRIQKFTLMKNNNTNHRQKLVALAIILLSAISVAWLNPGKHLIPAKDATTASIKASHFAFFNYLGIQDTTVPAPTPAIAMVAPPPPPLVPATPQLPPPPPHGVNIMMPDSFATDTLPMPDSMGIDTSLNLSFHFKMDTNWAKIDSMQIKYFSSPEWKKQQELIRKKSLAMAKMMQSKEWKAHMEAVKELQAKMQQYMQSPEWKAQQETIKKMSDSMKLYFNSKAWKDYQDKIQQYAMNMQLYMNSDQWKNYEAQIQKYALDMQQYVNSKAWKDTQQQLYDISKKQQDAQQKLMLMQQKQMTDEKKAEQQKIIRDTAQRNSNQ